MTTVLITGATDGIGLTTAKLLCEQGHEVLLHGRSANKLEAAQQALAAISGNTPRAYEADLTDLSAVRTLAEQVRADHSHLDVLINNAGVFKIPNPVASNGWDKRFTVNTLAPYLLTQLLLPAMSQASRVVNLSSAAQAPVNIEALRGNTAIDDDFTAYAQSKLAITSWSYYLAHKLGNQGPTVVAVNPGSMLASKMVKEGFGVAGNDLRIGADILIRAALSDEFANAAGEYFDNDAKRFAPPHPDTLNDTKMATLIATIEELIA